MEWRRKDHAGVRRLKTHHHWLENIEPWCISRQLWWGHQIPVWYGVNISTDKASGPTGDLDEVDIGSLLVDDGMIDDGEIHHCAASLRIWQRRFMQILLRFRSR